MKIYKVLFDALTTAKPHNEEYIITITNNKKNNELKIYNDDENGFMIVSFDDEPICIYYQDVNKAMYITNPEEGEHARVQKNIINYLSISGIKTINITDL